MGNYILMYFIGLVIGSTIATILTKIACHKEHKTIGGVDIIDIVEDGIPYQQWQLHVGQEAMREIKNNEVISLRVKRIKGGNE